MNYRNCLKPAKFQKTGAENRDLEPVSEPLGIWMSGAERWSGMGSGEENGIGQIRKGGKGIGRLAVALAVAYVVTAVALFGIAFVMLKLQPDTKTTELLILAVYVLSCFAGGWYAGHLAGRRKFLQGLLVGLLYFGLLFLISGMGERELQSDLAGGGLACLLCAAGGMLGGMLA